MSNDAGWNSSQFPEKHLVFLTLEIPACLHTFWHAILTSFFTFLMYLFSMLILDLLSLRLYLSKPLKLVVVSSNVYYCQVLPVLENL